MGKKEKNKVRDFVEKLIKKVKEVISSFIGVISRHIALPADRALAGNKSRQFFIPLIFIGLSMLVVMAIWWKWNGAFSLSNPDDFIATDSYRPESVLDAAYFYLFGSGSQNMFPHSHVVGFLMTTLGLLLMAILTSSFTNYLDKRARGYLSGDTAYRLKNHIVILGASDIAYSIIKQYAKGNDYWFLIETGKDVEKTRMEFYSFFEEGIKDNRIVFKFGERTSKDDIEKLCLAQAKEIFVIGDSDESDSIESYRDSYNMDSVKVIADEIKKHGNGVRIPCHVLFEYQSTFSVYQFTDLDKSIKDYIDFRPFNFYDMWAQKVLIKGKAGHIKEDEKNRKDGKDGYLYHYYPLNTVSISEKGECSYIDYNSDKTVHLIIVGMAKMGISMAVQAAHICHFPNYVRDPSLKTRITFIDANAAVEKDFFMGRYRELMRLSRYRYVDADKGWCDHCGWKEPEDDFLDIEWEFINGRVEQPEIQDYIKDAVSKKDHIVTLAICLPKSHQSIATALYLPKEVYENDDNDNNCLQILTYQRLSGYILDSIAKTQFDKNNNPIDSRYKKLRPFGMIEYGFDQVLDDDTAARMISYVYDYHAKNKVWDIHLEQYNEELYQKGDWWKEHPVSNCWSSQFNAHSIPVKLQSVGCHYDLMPCSRDIDVEAIREKLNAQRDNLKKVEHNRWNMEKLLSGFRAFDQKEERDFRNASQEARKDFREKWKLSPKYAHLDIRSYKDVKDLDPEVVAEDNDRHLIEAIPEIIKRVREKQKQ